MNRIDPQVTPLRHASEVSATNASPAPSRYVHIEANNEKGCWAFLKKIFHSIFCCLKPKDQPPPRLEPTRLQQLEADLMEFERRLGQCQRFLAGATTPENIARAQQWIANAELSRQQVIAQIAVESGNQTTPVTTPSPQQQAVTRPAPPATIVYEGHTLEHRPECSIQ